MVTHTFHSIAMYQCFHLIFIPYLRRTYCNVTIHGYYFHKINKVRTISYVAMYTTYFIY